MWTQPTSSEINQNITKSDLKQTFICKLYKREMYKNIYSIALTLWSLRVFWGPGEVLTWSDICAFSSCLLTFEYLFYAKF